MKHIKCGSTVTAKAKITTVFFNTFSVLSKDHLIITPTQIIGDNIDFEFDKTVYCRTCKEDIPLDSDQLIVGICPECRKSVTPKDSEIIIYGGESALVAHKECADKVVETYIVNRGIEDFTRNKLVLQLKEI